MNMAPLMLKKNPEIVETVRKCRKYTGSAEIRELADKCYQRFKVRADGHGRGQAAEPAFLHRQFVRTTVLSVWDGLYG